MATIAIQKRMHKQMTELQVKSDHHTRQMIAEKKRVDDLDEALKQAEEQIQIFRQSTKNSAVTLLNQHRNKLIAQLENKLNKLLIRQSLTEASNQKLKHQINSLRRHRMTSNKSHEQMEVGIRDTQRKVRAVLERSQEVQMEERERFAEQMLNLSEYVERQNAAFEESLMASAAATGITKRPPGAGAAGGGGGLAYGGDDDEALETRGELTIAEERVKIELVDDYARQIDREEGAMAATQEKIALFKQSFDELKRVSALDDLVEIVRRYVASEEETFSLFNYVQALNQETGWTLERHKRLEEEIRSYEEKLAEEEATRAEAMGDLQEKWRSAKEATDECANAATEAQRTLERIAKKVQSLFFKIQCDQVVTQNKGPRGGHPSNKPLLEAAAAGAAAAGKGGGAAAAIVVVPSQQPQPSAGARQQDSRLALLTGQGVTESNIVSYAELIEHRALEIMSEYMRKTRGAQDHHRLTPVLEPSRSLVDPNANDHLIRPPDVDADDDLDNDDDDTRPIQLDEMRRRTAEKLTKKLQKSKTKALKGGVSNRAKQIQQQQQHASPAMITL